MTKYYKRPPTIEAHQLNIKPYPQWLEYLFDDNKILKNNQGHFILIDNPSILIPDDAYIIRPKPFEKIEWYYRSTFEKMYKEEV